MTDATQTELLSSPSFAGAAAHQTGGRRSYLFGPVVDFLLLGGGSAIVLGLIAAFLPAGTASP